MILLSLARLSVPYEVGSIASGRRDSYSCPSSHRRLDDAIGYPGGNPGLSEAVDRPSLSSEVGEKSCTEFLSISGMGL
jgi:hypothetical protein